MGFASTKDSDVLCIWGRTREEIIEGYDEVFSWGDDAPNRITWRLSSSFNDKKVGDECYAPNDSKIRKKYGNRDRSDNGKPMKAQSGQGNSEERSQNDSE